MKLFQLISFSLLSNPLLFAAACDCTHFPYKPTSCEKICSTALLEKADKSDLVEKIGLDPITADKILDFRKDKAILSINELPLDPNQKRVVKSKLGELSPNVGKELAQTYGSSDTSSSSPTDQQLQRRIQAKVSADKTLSRAADSIEVSVHDGKVTLSGSVGSEDEKGMVMKDAAAIVGHANVSDKLTIKEGPS